MGNSIVDKLRRVNPFSSSRPSEPLPRPLPANPDQRLVKVFVEGYEDVAFWRGVFDHFVNPYLRFEISVPNREDLPKGKKVLLGMIPRSSQELILCVDSDFDYLFDGTTPQSRQVNAARFMFHTYAYATENFLCYAPSLHNVCVKATKNDTRIFDFERFMEEYSRTIYPVFLWYAYSAQLATENVFTLLEFKNTVRLGYLDIADNGAKTIAWLARNVARREQTLAQKHPGMGKSIREFESRLRKQGLTPETAYLFMHGHTLMDNVVIIAVSAVCETLRQRSIAKITSSKKQGVALKNEMSNYTNTLRSIRDVLLDNENYTQCPLFLRLRQDIRHYMETVVWEMKQRGELPGDAVVADARHMPHTAAP